MKEAFGSDEKGDGEALRDDSSSSSSKSLLYVTFRHKRSFK